MKKLIFVTGNAHKAKYLSDYFHMPVDHMKLDLREIQSLDVEEIAMDKARIAYEIVKSPVLVEDASLVFTSLKALPGPLIKWFLETFGNEGLCKLLDNHADRGATAQVSFALCDENGVHVFSGSVQGMIAETPRGEMGFGWDSIFIPKGHEKTWAEMGDNEKHETSMRRIALEKMAKYLSDN